MYDYDNAFNAVARITGISKRKILSAARIWKIHEARMLFVLLISRLGREDNKIALVLNRSRTTILKTRHKAEEYMTVSRTFSDKFNQISQTYAISSQTRNSQE